MSSPILNWNFKPHPTSISIDDLPARRTSLPSRTQLCPRELVSSTFKMVGNSPRARGASTSSPANQSRNYYYRPATLPSTSKSTHETTKTIDERERLERLTQISGSLLFRNNFVMLGSVFAGAFALSMYARPSMGATRQPGGGGESEGICADEENHTGLSTSQQHDSGIT